jgi:hypothetical protein
MQYFHGISASSGKPFSPPLEFKTLTRNKPGKLEKKVIKHGKCHKCSKWIAVEGIKEGDSKVPEIYWYTSHRLPRSLSDKKQVETRCILPPWKFNFR